MPEKPRGMVLFVHGSGSSHLSPRNAFVAKMLNQASFATLLIDLLTPKEDQDHEARFNIDLLTKRVVQLIDFLAKAHGDLPLGLFGASTGAAAALCAAKERSDKVRAIVSRGGRPDLAKKALAFVKAPTLLIVGGLDDEVIELNQYAYDLLTCPKQLQIVPKATHLFEEPGCLDQVVRFAQNWFETHLM